MILSLAILAMGVLYLMGILKFTFTGVTKPFIGLSIFGFSVTLVMPKTTKE